MISAGYVLAGGGSSRMGRDKAALPYRGDFLARFVAREVERAAGSVALIGDPRRLGSLGFPVIADAYPGEGPLGGIITALASTAADWNLITACDMPGLTAGFLARLLDVALGSDAAAVVPVGPSGRPEPLCAAYHRRAREAFEGAFARGVRKVKEAIQEVPAAWLVEPEVAQFQNVNTPEEWALYARE